MCVNYLKIYKKDCKPLSSVFLFISMNKRVHIFKKNKNIFHIFVVKFKITENYQYINFKKQCTKSLINVDIKPILYIVKKTST